MDRQLYDDYLKHAGTSKKVRYKGKEKRDWNDAGAQSHVIADDSQTGRHLIDRGRKFINGKQQHWFQINDRTGKTIKNFYLPASTDSYSYQDNINKAIRMFKQFIAVKVNSK